MKAYLKLYQPNEKEYGLYNLSELFNPLTGKNSITIGRADEDGQFDINTDIKLPAEDKLVSRKHFSIELKADCYFSVKNQNSTHPALLKKANKPSVDVDNYVIDENEYRLEDGDRILVQSNFSVEANPFWTFCFYDPDQTDSCENYPFEVKYNYNLTSKLLFVNSRNLPTERIDYTGNELRLLDCMANKVYENQDKHCFSSHEELISGVWPDYIDSPPPRQRLRPHVSKINQEIANKFGKNAPKLIENIHGHGYRLNNCLVTTSKLYN
ncbi:FHA domain-containing protein [Gloeothece verrucosa]|uniref:FHA domain containing protein n=1 Tax=Gloeothece verrucosa (strain PCC 7822) TaxID=497965 RepID=E0U9K3_GLOV7|nr:FHA domain-containing protein [Gloeothece verrucosa]ADN13804.1 FHA domain containing protein [Gloeothece verrucosa PCC 7822]